MKTGINVVDAMTIRPVQVDSGMSIVECAKMMKSSHIGSLIIKEEGKIIGIITDQDFVRKVIAKELDPKKVKAGEIVKRNLISISPGKDIYDALKLMQDNNIRHLPVMDGGKMVGFLTIKDILKIQPQLFEIIVGKFELKEEERKISHALGNIPDSEGICNECGDYSPDISNVGGALLCKKCKKARNG